MLAKNISNYQELSVISCFVFSIFFLQIEPFLKVLVDDRSRAFLLQKLLSATRRILQGRWRSSPGSVVCGAKETEQQGS